MADLGDVLFVLGHANCALDFPGPRKGQSVGNVRPSTLSLSRLGSRHRPLSDGGAAGPGSKPTSITNGFEEELCWTKKKTCPKGRLQGLQQRTRKLKLEPSEVLNLRIMKGN